MTASRYDRIGTSVPVNKMAATVTGKGVHWEPAKKLTATWQDTPLPVLPMPPNVPGAMINPMMKIGRLTVIGYGGKRSNGATYVVRCVCGLYGYQKAKSLRERPLNRQLCDRCDYLEQMKSGELPSPEERVQLRAEKSQIKVKAMTPDAGPKLGYLLADAIQRKVSA